MKKLFTILYLTVLSTSLTIAQDVHLTQFYTSNQSLNPALTGNYDGDIRAVVNYRSQWKQVIEPLTTTMFSVEKKFVIFNHTIGIGLIAINDRLTTYGLQNNKFYLSGSYSRRFNKNIIGIGVQGGYALKSTDLAGQSFPDQWNNNNGTFDPNISNNEAGIQANQSYININSGVSFTRLMQKKILNVNYALFNINNPQYGFISEKTKLPFRHVVNSSLSIPLNNTLTIKPQLLYMTTVGATDFIIGANATKKINAELALLLGLGLRGGTVNGDAGMIIGGVNYKRFETALSYDINFSTLSNDTPRKSVWEISLIYTTPSRNISKSTINCDRY